MPVEITMPQQSDTMTEGTVVKWVKKEGDKVRAGEIIAEIETDKATMEMESFEAGTLAHISVQEGGKIPVGGVMAVLATAKESPADVKKQYSGASAKAPAARPEPVAASAAQKPRQAAAAERVPPSVPSRPAGHSLENASSGELHEPDEAGHGATREAATPVPPLPTGHGNGNGNNGGRVFVSPLARRIAADKGVDLSQIQGSGPGGRIVQRDVLNFQPAPAATKSAGPSQPAAPQPVLPTRVPRGQKEVIPLTKMRAAIAAALQRSKQTVPHFYETIDIDIEELSAARVRLNEMLKPENVKISISDFVSKAAAVALLRHPAVNAHFGEDGITRFGDVNLGIAVAIPDGLIVPVLRGIDQMGLREIRLKSEDLIKRARAQKLKQDEMRGATFTISNLGSYGVREFSAIINPPEVAILAVASAEKRAVVRNDQIVARTMLTVTLSADHRAVDGATAAEFLRTLKGLLEEPALMLV
jgi:pyruvate dehydrogenase E2 component (dihydrolipoamide acetyltransferase)